jgi:hypothetical protein
VTCGDGSTGRFPVVTVVETILVYAVAPLAVIAVLALLTLVPGRSKRPRYKPGQAWEHEPVWYEPHPEHPTAEHDVPAYGAAVPGGGTQAIGSSLYGEPQQSGHGRALESGHGSGGASAASAPAQPIAVGPRGGARGTW